MDSWTTKIGGQVPESRSLGKRPNNLMFRLDKIYQISRLFQNPGIWDGIPWDSRDSRFWILDFASGLWTLDTGQTNLETRNPQQISHISNRIFL